MPEINWKQEAAAELLRLPVQEQLAVRSAVVKLRELGGALGFPHQSSVRGAKSLRELRPRAGRSPWRVFYRRTGEEQFVIGAIGPEAAVDPKGFKRSVRLAQERLSEYQEYKGRE